MAKIATKASINKIELSVNKVQAIQTTRGFSDKAATALSTFDHFNLGLHVSDSASSVLANRENLKNTFPQNTQIQWLEQVHSNNVLITETLITPYPAADAIITHTPNLALAVMTADCLPILLTSISGKEVAAIHCGWRSTVNNIISHTINKMTSMPEDIIAWLGPCISQEYFEVGEEVKAAFTKEDFKLAAFFIENSNKKYQADLSGIAKFLLQKVGVKTIIQSTECTYANEDKYYSYRRDGVTGRMASVIYIKE
ncbi:peptidoglycan editing factor PgeF [Thalassotalea piscium]